MNKHFTLRMSERRDLTIILPFPDLKNKIILSKLSEQAIWEISNNEKNLTICNHKGNKIFHLPARCTAKIIIAKPKWHQFIKRIKGEGIWKIELKS